MPERDDFVALRDLLEADAYQPAFTVIRARRRHRSHAMAAIASVVIGAVVLAIGSVLAGVGRSPAPIGTETTPPLPTSTDDTGDGYYRSNVDSLVRAPSGSVYALVNSCRPVDQRCEPSQGRYQLLMSQDLATSWTTMGDAPIGGRLLAASDVHLWIIGSTYLFNAVSTVGSTAVPDVITAAGSADGGRTWRSWALDDVTVGSVGEHSSDTAGGTLWISHGTRVYTASGLTRPTLTPTQPDVGNIYRIVAIGPDHAIVQGAPDVFAPTVWFETTDRGTHWTRITDPCAGTSQPGTYRSSMAVARDGSWWVACVGEPGRSAMPGATPGPQTPREVCVSTDSGRTWQRRGALTDQADGEGLVLYPISATTAWRTDRVGDLMRTVDGTSWSSVASLRPGVFANHLVAIDARTAVYIQESLNSTIPVIAVTSDGGQTWITRPLPPPST